jgi:hypothetical protein
VRGCRFHIGGVCDRQGRRRSHLFRRNLIRGMRIRIQWFAGRRLAQRVSAFVTLDQELFFQCRGLGLAVNTRAWALWLGLQV